MEIQTIDIDKIIPAPYNPRLDLKPGDADYEKLKRSIEVFDLVEPLVWNKATGHLVGGHQRLKILLDRGDKKVQVSVVNLDDDNEKALNLALNKISGDWDLPKLKDLLQELDTGALDLDITGFDTNEIEELMTQFHVGDDDKSDDPDHKTLAEKFIVPPFSILDARQGYWQARKRAWLSLGLQSELGRGENTAPGKGPVNIKISAKCAKLLFDCTVEGIVKGCHGSCCQAAKGVLISLLPPEVKAQEAAGFLTEGGLMMPDLATGRCPHKLASGLCGIHPDKPFGCIASPFTLNSNDTLITRNRYRVMKCYGHGLPAYKTFRASLDLILGDKLAASVCKHLDDGGGDIQVDMPRASYDALKYLDSLKHTTDNSVPFKGKMKEPRSIPYQTTANQDMINRDGKYTVKSADPAKHSHLTQRRLDAEARSNVIGAPKLPSWAQGKNTVTNMAQGTSIFDPVLCEIAYKWFCVDGGRVLDPFAGEAVKGIVAAYLGLDYVGIEIRSEQIEANELQARNIKVNPSWILGDSIDLHKLVKGQEFDLLFTSPPYFDLEIYSKDIADGSTFADYELFKAWHADIIGQAVAHLKDNRFAVWKVGDIRDDAGFYRNFVSDTIQAFIDAGMKLYNEAILITAFGSLPIRVGKAFGSYRKLGKTHQNILVFYKGDIKQIKNDYTEIDVTEILAAQADPGVGD